MEEYWVVEYVPGYGISIQRARRLNDNEKKSMRNGIEKKGLLEYQMLLNWTIFHGKTFRIIISERANQMEHSTDATMKLI